MRLSLFTDRFCLNNIEIIPDLSIDLLCHVFEVKLLFIILFLICRLVGCWLLNVCY